MIKTEIGLVGYHFRKMFLHLKISIYEILHLSIRNRRASYYIANKNQEKFNMGIKRDAIDETLCDIDKYVEGWKIKK